MVEEGRGPRRRPRRPGCASGLRLARGRRRSQARGRWRQRPTFFFFFGAVEVAAALEAGARRLPPRRPCSKQSPSAASGAKALPIARTPARTSRTTCKYPDTRPDHNTHTHTRITHIHRTSHVAHVATHVTHVHTRRHTRTHHTLPYPHTYASTHPSRVCTRTSTHTIRTQTTTRTYN